jgi:hypothetical protein
MPLGEPLRPRKEVFDYSRANESGGGSKTAAASGGAYMKVYVRLRPNEGGNGAELSYNLPEQNKISIKENREPFPQEHQFTFHRIYERDAPQEVSHFFHVIYRIHSLIRWYRSTLLYPLHSNIINSLTHQHRYYSYLYHHHHFSINTLYRRYFEM